MSAPFSKLQKRLLSQLAARAFRRECALARGRGEDPDASWRAHETWRHQQVAAACGKLGLRCCSQDDYKLVEAHFLHLLGEDGRAMAALVRHQAQPRSTAEAVLWRELQQAADVGITREYVAAICRRQFGCSLLDASENHLWHLVYTVRNRAAEKRRKRTANARQQSRGNAESEAA